jgi:hypothetical protein
MGFRNYDRWSAVEWRRTAETVEQMRRAGWDVVSYCRTCHLTMTVDLDVIATLRGPQTVLWNRQARCRRIGCGGTVEFRGKNPKITRYLRLIAQWPEP